MPDHALRSRRRRPSGRRCRTRHHGPLAYTGHAGDSRASQRTAVINGGSVPWHVNSGGLSYNTDARWRNAGVLAAYFPFRGAFCVTVGAFYNDSRVNLNAVPSMVLTLLRACQCPRASLDRSRVSCHSDSFRPTRASAGTSRRHPPWLRVYRRYRRDLAAAAHHTQRPGGRQQSRPRDRDAIGPRPDRDRSRSFPVLPGDWRNLWVPLLGPGPYTG